MGAKAVWCICHRAPQDGYWLAVQSRSDLLIVESGSRLVRFFSSLDLLISFICRWLLIGFGTALLFAVLIAVIARYVIEVGGIDWAEELPKQMYAWFIMAGVVLATQRGQHIAVDLIFRLINPSASRILLVLVNASVTLAYSILSITSFKVADIASIEVNAMLGTPGSLPFYALALGSLLTAVSSLSIALKIALLGLHARPEADPENSVV